MHDQGNEADLERAARQGGADAESGSDDEARNDVRLQFLGGASKGCV